MHSFATPGIPEQPAGGSPALGLPRDEMFDENLGGEFQLPVSPLRIEDFRIYHPGRSQSPETEESHIQIGWRNPPGITGLVSIFRSIEPLVTRVGASGFQQLVLPNDLENPAGWTVLSTYPVGRDSYMDDDIPPVNLAFPKATRRRLGSLYSYKVEISGGERAAYSPVLSTQIRGINSPRITEIDEITHNSAHVHWSDKSDLASGFRLRIYAYGMENVQSHTVTGTARTDLVVNNLSPDMQYGVAVHAWDYYGRSNNGFELFTTLPSPDQGPTDQTFDLNLTRQEVWDGPSPFLGRFPVLGNIPGGTLQGVSLNPAWPALLFVKPGRFTSECNNPDAVVRLAPGASLTADEMVELFSSATPSLPLVFIACIEENPVHYNWVPIRLTYRV